MKRTWPLIQMIPAAIHCTVQTAGEMFRTEDGGCSNGQRKSNEHCALDETLISLISVSCSLHVLQSIYIQQNVNKYS